MFLPIKNIQRIINKFKRQTNQLTSLLGNLIQSVDDYENSYQIQEFPNEDESDEMLLKNGETYFDCFYETLSRNNRLIESQEKVEKAIDTFKSISQTFYSNCLYEQKRLQKMNNELIDKLIQIQYRLKTKQNEQHSESNSETERNWKEMKKLDYDSFKIVSNEMKLENERKNNDEENERFSNVKEYLSKDEMRTIEDWTKLSVSHIVFDSTDLNNNHFEFSIMNRKNLLFIITIENDEMFGFYLKHPITEMNKTIYDKNCFVFKLRQMQQNKNDIIQHFEKIDLQDDNNAITFSNQKETITIGNNSIVIMKENEKEKSFYNNDFMKKDNHNVEKTFFEIKHIIVIQMIQSEEIENINEIKDKNNDNTFSHHKTELEQLLNMKIESLLFDSQKDDWNINTSTFDSNIINKKQLAFLIQDTNENIFGCYIDALIDSHVYLVDKDWKGKMIHDPKSCVFSLYSNERIQKPMKFNIKQGYENWAFQLYQKEWGALFSVGSGNDICVKKQERSNKCYCKQASFDYHGIENALIGGNQQKMGFCLQRILVYQMTERNNWKEIEELKQSKCEKEMKEVNIQEEIQNKELMKKENEQRQINILEAWTGKKFVDVIFDSDNDNWNKDHSTFDSILKGLSNIVIIIEDTERNRFGGYIESTIDDFTTINSHDDKLLCSPVSDENSFLFTFESNGRCLGVMKFDMKEEDKEYTFVLYPSNHELLFSMGKGEDICIYKENNKTSCYCTPLSYDYRGLDDVLVGKKGSSNPFTVKKITVLQMEIESDSLIKKEKRKLTSILHQWTGMNWFSILFDSEKDDWSVGTSTFDNSIIGKGNIAILIEDNQQNVFGCFIHQPIISYRQRMKRWWKGERVTDDKAFVFSIHSNDRLDEMKMFPIREEKSSWAFALYDQDEEGLFAVGGGNDIYVKKSEYKDQCFCIQSSFDYQGIEDALIGESFYHSFTVKNILVVQFK